MTDERAIEAASKAYITARIENGFGMDHAMRLALAAAGRVAGEAELGGLIDLIIRDVAELPDRTSPPDDPEAMTVSGSELRDILRVRLSAAPAATDRVHGRQYCPNCSCVLSYATESSEPTQ